MERYRLLETVRQYALERLVESGDEAHTRDRHLGFYVALSQRAGPEMLGLEAGIAGAPGSTPSAKTSWSRSPMHAARPEAAWRA